ncbi:hypothetical protein [Burkholderia multivorans]|uniref:hypothetical protein n=1 Tax=Burkholderia multivorans TaxID=87883 RepID=UPI001F34252E|nr:hypothetical protein [Burkholderia multivorans]
MNDQQQSRADALTEQTELSAEAGRADTGEPASSVKAQDGFQVGSKSVPMKSVDAISAEGFSMDSRREVSSIDGMAAAEELRKAAIQFHNLTHGDPTVIIRPPSAEKRDAIIAAGKRLRRAILATSANETGAEGAKPVAWFIDWPDEPELGHYFAEEPCDPTYGRSRALGFIESRSPTMAALAPADEPAALTLLRRAHHALAWAALTQIPNGERLWDEIGEYLKGRAAAPANELTDADIWHMWNSIDQNVSATRPILFARALLSRRAAAPAPAHETGAEGSNDLNERAHLAAGQWANANTPISEALAYRDGYIAGARSPAMESPAPAEEMIRFCPECGRLGDIPAGYEACCPDWSEARIVPKRFAELCAETFRLCVSQPLPQSAAAPADERATGMPDEVRDSLMDSRYLAGVTAGWNAALADDPTAALKKINDAYSGYLKPLRDWQKAGRPGAHTTPATADQRAAMISNYLNAPGMWAQVYCCAVFVRGCPSDVARSAADAAVKEFGDAACKTVADLIHTLDEVLRVN